MDYKEKLKLAKEALDSGSYDKETIEYIFPELAESEEERIRKELIEFIKSRGGFKGEWIAWLEKQIPSCLSHDDEIMIRQLTEYFTTGKGLQNTNDTVVEWLTDIKRKLEKQGEQKPWSEEDEYKYNTILHHLDLRKEKYKKECNQEEQDRYQCLYDWFKIFKDRVGCEANCTTTKEWSEEDEVIYHPENFGLQKPAEWSKEDERLFQIIIDILDKEEHKGHLSHADLIACVRKLKSLRPQLQWRPSDAQMDSITCTVRKMKESACYDSELVSLFNDLKKLREE